MVKTSRGSISVYACGDQEKPALITYPDVALNCMFHFLSPLYLLLEISHSFSCLARSVCYLIAFGIIWRFSCKLVLVLCIPVNKLYFYRLILVF